MREYRRLPPRLRMASFSLGVLFPLAGMALVTAAYFTDLLSPYLGFTRMALIAGSLIWLGQAGTLVSLAYQTHVGRPALGPFPLDSWQSQVRALLVLSAPPLCGIAVALVISPSSRAFGLDFLILLLGAVVLWLPAFVATVLGMEGNGPVRTPPTR